MPDFVWEVWTLVSQLTVYDKDVDEFSEGRYALETLTRTGGDCEDLALLDYLDYMHPYRHIVLSNLLCNLMNRAYFQSK